MFLSNESVRTCACLFIDFFINFFYKLLEEMPFSSSFQKRNFCMERTEIIRILPLLIHQSRAVLTTIRSLKRFWKKSCITFGVCLNLKYFKHFMWLEHHNHVFKKILFLCMFVLLSNDVNKTSIYCFVNLLWIIKCYKLLEIIVKYTIFRVFCS